MTQPNVTTPYSSISPLVGTKPSWVPEVDQDRIASYNAYDDLYWNESQTFRLLMRGGDAEEDVIYIPNPRKIVDTLHRYVGAKLNFTVDENTGTPQSRADALVAFTALFRREAFFSKYNANRRFGILRGDWIWHVMADPMKPEGTRISLVPVHPGNYFPVFESDVVEGGSPDKIVKVHLAEEIVSGDETIIRRQTYEKIVNPNGTVTIWSSLATFELEEWYEEGGKALNIITQPFALPPDITAIPVYHVRNFDEPGNPFGSSSLRGFLRLMAAINQSYTDEDIALALEGLGVYATDSAQRPIDAESGEVTDWNIYPGRVLQNAGDIKRINGVTSVTPYTEHITRMTNELKEASAVTDAALGRVDVQVAESGVALALHFAPTLALAEEKDQIILDVHNQMFHDLRAWLKVYEGINLDDVTVLATLGEKLPKNRKATIDMVVALLSTVPPVLSAQSAREFLIREGINPFAPDEAARVLAEQAQNAAMVDPLGARANEELGGGDIGGNPDNTGSEG